MQSIHQVKQGLASASPSPSASAEKMRQGKLNACRRGSKISLQRNTRASRRSFARTCPVAAAAQSGWPCPSLQGTCSFQKPTSNCPAPLLRTSRATSAAKQPASAPLRASQAARHELHTTRLQEHHIVAGAAREPPVGCQSRLQHGLPSTRQPSARETYAARRAR